MPWIFRDHLLERPESSLDRVATWFIHEETSLQIQRVQLGIYRVCGFRQTPLLRRSDGGANLVRYVSGQVGLQRENVGSLSFIGSGPDNMPLGQPDQPHIQTHKSARKRYGSLDNSLYIQLTGYIGQRPACTFVMHCRRTRHNFPRPDQRQRRD